MVGHDMAWHKVAVMAHHRSMPQLDRGHWSSLVSTPELNQDCAGLRRMRASRRATAGCSATYLGAAGVEVGQRERRHRQRVIPRGRLSRARLARSSCRSGPATSASASRGTSIGSSILRRLTCDVWCLADRWVDPPCRRQGLGRIRSTVPRASVFLAGRAACLAALAGATCGLPVPAGLVFLPRFRR